MVEIAIRLRNGRRIPFEVDSDVDGPACFVFGIRKSGSTLLNAIVAELARLNGRRFVNAGDTFFRHNVLAIDWQFDPALAEIVYPGNIYGGFRNMPFSLVSHPLFDRSPKVLIVRDPRDALVSDYFSNAYSHPIPDQTSDASDVKALLERQRKLALEKGPDRFVVDQANEMGRTILEFGTVAKSLTTKVFKYEDYIFDKPRLIREITQHFGWKLNDGDVDGILQWADVRPEKEDSQAFIRKVTPGDHREKLQPATIARINELLARAMLLLDYHN